MEMKYNDADNRYLLLDSRNVPLAHVVLESSTDNGLLTVRFTDKETENAQGHEIYRLLGIGKNQPPIQCQLVKQRDRRMVLERISYLEPEQRKDLRVPLHGKSFLYYTVNDTLTRCEIEFVDISCGGTAFYGPIGLENVGDCEIVLLITANPLIVACKILNARELRSEKALYAAKFLNLCNDEETMIREGVFSVQLESRARQSTI